jgi:predicted nucleotidyltransferase
VHKDNIQLAINKIKTLENHQNYLGAFVFGSVARNDITDDSDLDVQVIIAEDNPHIDILHPTIEGIKLDLSFCSLEQIKKQHDKELQRVPARIPMITESIILFDKYGLLSETKQYYQSIQAPKFKPADFPEQRFLLHHANNKVERNIISDPASALLAMHIGINDVLKIHYGIHGKWWVSNKRMLPDLGLWDQELKKMLEIFLTTGEITQKFEEWRKIIRHVSHAMGEHLDITLHEGITEISKKGLEDLSHAITQPSPQ